MLTKQCFILPDASELLGNSLQSGRIASNFNDIARVNSDLHVVLIILSHSSLVGKTTFCSRQEKMGNSYRQRKGIASWLHPSLSSVPGRNEIDVEV